MARRVEDWRPAGVVRMARGASVLALRGAIVAVLGMLLAATWLLIAARRRASLKELTSRAQEWGSHAIRRTPPLPSAR